MKKFVLCLIAIPVLLSILYYGSSGTLAAEYFTGESKNRGVPKGLWSLTEGDTWRFIFEEDVMLTEEQYQKAIDNNIFLEEALLPAGTSVTTKVIELLFPDAMEEMSTPKRDPTLAPFELTGKWFYDENDELYYRHNDDAMPLTKEEVFAKLQQKEVSNDASEKIIYLTIDDTPSAYTMEFLSVLKELNVKATFFVVGSYVRSRPTFMKAIYEEGHVIANHSYSHSESSLKKSFSSCLSEFKRTEEEVENALGFRLEMPIIRIPYGSTILSADFCRRLQEEGYYWIDWNALNGDTESNIKSDDAALQRAFTTAGRYDGSIVMLVHDGKKRTIRTLPEMVKHFRDLGYEFRVLDLSVPKIPGVRSGLPIEP